MCMCVCRGEAFLVLLLKCCCCCSIINYFHITPMLMFHMCDVALLAMSGRGLATLVSAEVVMTGTQWQLQTTASCPGAALPASDTPGQALARIKGAEEMEASSSTWSAMIQVHADVKKYDVSRRIHNAHVINWTKCQYYSSWLMWWWKPFYDDGRQQKGRDGLWTSLYPLREIPHILVGRCA